MDGNNASGLPPKSESCLASGTVVTRLAKGRVVTVAVTAMAFHCPVFVGDEVSCYASVVKPGWAHLDHGEDQKLCPPWPYGEENRSDRGTLHLCGGRLTIKAAAFAANHRSLVGHRRRKSPAASVDMLNRETNSAIESTIQKPTAPLWLVGPLI
jgi:hypothetical protein